MKKKSRMRVVVWVAVGLAGLVGGAAAFAVWGPHANAERADASGVAAEWRAWREAEDAAGFEAWDALLAAGARVEEHARERFPGDRADMRLALERLLTGAWDDPRHAEDREQLGETGELVEEILAAAEKPWGSWRQKLATDAEEEDGFSMYVGVIPEGGRERRLMAELLRVSMRESAARGDWEGVERLTRGALRLARHSFVGAGMLAQGTAVAKWALAAEECVRVGAEEEAPREVCERLARVIEEGRLPAELLSRASEGDRLMQLGMVRTRYNRHGLWMMGSDEIAGEWPILLPVGLMEESSVWDRVANVRAYFEARLEAADGEIEASAARREAWIAVLEEDEGDWEAMRREGERVLDGEGLRKHSLGSNRAAVKNWMALRQTERGAVAALKVAGWRAEKGEWPSGLEEVLSEEERENPATGREFVYVAGEEAGGGFWLMAVGLEEWKQGEWRGGMWRDAYREREREEWE